MLRLSRRLAEHLPSFAQHTTPVYHTGNPNAFWARRWRRFTQRGLLGKIATVFGYGAAGIGAYLGTCLVVRVMHQPSVDALFTSGKDYTLEEWRTVEPTLQPGDIILMRGTGLMSWTISTLHFMYSFMRPAGLRYSHVAVVVAPAIIEYVDGDGDDSGKVGTAASTPYQVNSLDEIFAEAASSALSSSSSSLAVSATSPQGSGSVHEQLQAEESALRRRPVMRRGAIILEAMDNKDYNVPDVTGVVTHDTVQVVEASRRIFSTTPSSSGSTPAYRYFAVRRLRNYEHTPERQAKMRQFCLDSVGRRMDGSLLYPLAFLSSTLHTLTHPLRSTVSDEVSCSELIVELYQHLGIIQRRWRWVPLDSTSKTTAQTLPCTGPSAAAAATAEKKERATTVPSPTPADATHDRSANSLHVYDYVYGRVSDRARSPVLSRDLPVLPATSTIEHGEALASPELRVRSAVAPLQPTWPDVDAQREFNDFYGRRLTGDALVAAREQHKTRMSATYVINSDTPAPTLRAGDLAVGLDGTTYQLQWYYRHSSLATCPYHFTEGTGESVLDFAMNIGLGPEIHMHIDRPDDTTAWILSED
jgi:hypothetical protein